MYIRTDVIMRVCANRLTKLCSVDGCTIRLHCIVYWQPRLGSSNYSYTCSISISCEVDTSAASMSLTDPFFIASNNSKRSAVFHS